MDITFILEAVVVLGAIVMGTRAGGVGIGVWGGLGVAVLVFVFGEAPGEPPIAALLIILAVVTAASLMQVAGGVDWMVKVAAGVIQRHPKQITVIAPLTAFAFTIGAGTSNILYPLLPVIYDVSYQNNIRPSRPLTVTVVQSGMSLAASPVSAAMAAMLTLTAVEPYNFDLAQILSITIPACIVGIVVTALVVGRMGKDIDEDPEIQERIASGALARTRRFRAEDRADSDQGGPQLGHRLPAWRRGDRDPRSVPRTSSVVRSRRRDRDHRHDHHYPAGDVHRCRADPDRRQAGCLRGSRGVGVQGRNGLRHRPFRHRLVDRQPSSPLTRSSSSQRSVVG